MSPEWWMVAVPMLILPFVGFVLLLAAWSLFWKGLALWHSGRRGQPWWFVIMLVVNTAGILEIIYLFFVAKLKFKDLFSMKEPHLHEHHNH
jgi:hypothetical protein